MGAEVDFLLESTDVIHSFWIPALNGKRDAVPGRVQPLTIEADGPRVGPPFADLRGVLTGVPLPIRQEVSP